MDLQLLSRIDDALDSLEVAALCFLCRDTVSRKSLEGVSIAYIVTVSSMPKKRVLIRIEKTVPVLYNKNV